MSNIDDIFSQPGDPVRSEHWNRLVEAVRASLLQTGQPGSYAAELGVTQGARPPIVRRPIRMKLVSEHDDHLVCEDVVTTQQIKVAKPPALRGDAATKTVGSKTHVIAPSYDADDEIYVVEVEDGCNVTASGKKLDMLDLNVDARRWAVACS